MEAVVIVLIALPALAIAVLLWGIVTVSGLLRRQHQVHEARRALDAERGGQGGPDRAPDPSAEGRLAALRRAYDAAVDELNTRRGSFPALIVATMFGIERAEPSDVVDPLRDAPP